MNKGIFNENQNAIGGKKKCLTDIHEIRLIVKLFFVYLLFFLYEDVVWFLLTSLLLYFIYFTEKFP